jgi:hypothetical protein
MRGSVIIVRVYFSGTWQFCHISRVIELAKVSVHGSRALRVARLMNVSCEVP